ncbi:hypothetical protein GCM10027447_12240 [Glycomyces halotolerans]
MTYQTSPAYRAYLTASQRCADAMAGIRIEADKGRRGQVIGYWLYLDGQLVESTSKRGTFGSETAARAHVQALRNPAPKPAPKPARLQPGWSNESKARRTVSADGGVGAMLGLASHVPAGSAECHYCGLDRRTCDCY